MASDSDAAKLALKLTVSERAIFASDLLHSLPPEFRNDDDEMTEDFDRDAEMDSDPAKCLTFKEFKRAVGE